MDKKTYPPFSVILETENLLTASAEDFKMALSSLMQQDVPLSLAQEVIVLVSGTIPNEIRTEITTTYPELKIVETDESFGYYEVKSHGAKLATGEIVVYADVDCQYDSCWLRSLLEPFAADESVDIVAGETVIAVENSYSMALAINYMLHRQKTQPKLQPAPRYYMNNVAFKRELLSKYNIPKRLPIFRGNCSIHSQILRQNGYIIWKQPLAKARHATPHGVRNYLWRFLLMGHDHYWLDILYDRVKQQKSGESAVSSIENLAQPLDRSTHKFKPKPLHIRLWNKLNYLFQQTRIYLKDSPDTIVYLPLALPIIFSSQFLILVGRLITKHNSHYLLKTYLDKFEPAYSEALKFDSLPHDAQQFQFNEVIGR